ncbi:MAG: hypothetical protein ACD_39C00832G0002 [uncultured bacterium]|nr:MAG: hypothetical protein ACD_39C00832G0002 [uncultured bacterium]
MQQINARTKSYDAIVSIECYHGRMNVTTSGSTGLDKLKAVFFLGLTCNLTTFTGCAVTWIVMAKNGWVSGIWQTAITVLSFIPIFMADAINNYTIGRIRLENDKGWDDVQISVQGRQIVARYYQFFRILSIIPAYLLAAAMIASFGSDESTIQTLKMAFLLAFSIHFYRCYWLLRRHISTRLPSFGGRRLLGRSMIIASIFTFWFLYFWKLPAQPFSLSQIFGSGLLYFLISAALQPLPTRYSLTRPGRPIAKGNFFKVEIIDDEQLNSLPGAAEINDSLRQPFSDAQFSAVANIRLPLIALPLFQSWGQLLISDDKKVLLLLLACEPHKGIHRTLISLQSGKYIITTDFGAQQAKFPGNVDYHLHERKNASTELLLQHNNRISELAEEFPAQPWQHLETIIKSVIAFLESENVRTRSSGTANGVISNEGAAR